VTPRRLLIGILLAGAAAGCIDPDDRPAKLSFIQPEILEPSCATANCHSATVARNGIDLSTIDGACLSLTEVSNYGTVSAFLEGHGPSVDYPQMPPDVPLPHADIRLIETWLYDAQTLTGDAKCE
jgi:hypothetical protein